MLDGQRLISFCRKGKRFLYLIILLRPRQHPALTSRERPGLRFQKGIIKALVTVYTWQRSVPLGCFLGIIISFQLLPPQKPGVENALHELFRLG